MRIAIAGLLHETSTFASQQTAYADFERAGAYRGNELLATFRGTSGTLGGALDACADLGLEPAPLLYSFATPSGVVTHDAYLTLRDEILERLEAAGPFDGVLLALHGAMVTDAEEDPEGDLLDAVRAQIGDEVPVIATLDLHGNLTPQMAAACTGWVGYKTYPHSDYHARAMEAVHILWAAAAGTVRPVIALDNIPILAPVQRMLTSEPPMSTLIERASEFECEPGVLSVTVTGGFPYADVEWAGVAASAVCDGDADAARRICDELRDVGLKLRDAFRHEAQSVRDGVAEAVASNELPVALIDASDNIGGGSAGDGTHVLAELFAQGAVGAVCTLHDPEAVCVAERAGVGATVELMVGGKTDTLHGPPVLVRACVGHLGHGSYRSERTGEPQSMGRTAVLRCDGVELVVTRLRVPAFDVEALRCVGIDPERRRIVVIKGAVQWQSSYGRICRRSIEVDAPGVTRLDLAQLPYQRVRRPIFPLDPLKKEVTAGRGTAG